MSVKKFAQPLFLHTNRHHRATSKEFDSWILWKVHLVVVVRLVRDEVIRQN